jgi:hypothetical protein
MVTIIGVEERVGENGTFNVIVLQGKPEVVKSKVSGMPYLTARKTSIPFTFEVEYAKSLIGTELPGEIERIECMEYEFVIPGKKKKTLKLNHKFRYDPNPTVLEEVVG